MSVCLFLTFRSRAPISANDLSALDRLLRAMPKLEKALVHAADADDPYLKDESPPALALQLYFPDLADLEAAASHSGPLKALASSAEFPILAAADGVQQAMLVRAFAVPDPKFQTTPGAPYCTYLVSYEGEAEDLNAWLDHYLEKHTEHMARFPGIRELEVYTRLDWVSRLPWPRVNFMQRNKVAFDSPKALTDALNSPVRHEMRADFKTFPSFTGPTNHFAMATRVVRPA
jgi:hypothetical protein